VGLGQIITLSAQVTASSPSVGTPTGTVVFYSGGVAIGVSISLSSTGGASLSIALPLGTNSITCTYSGDTNYALFTSVVTSVTILKSTINVAISSSITSPVAGQAISVTVTLTPGSSGAPQPTGTCTLLSGSTIIKTVTVITGVATFSGVSFNAGVQNLTITYSGDSNSTSTTGWIVITVRQDAALVTVTSTCQTVVLKAQLAPVAGSDTPTGSVIFYNAGVSLGNATIINGVATLTATLPAGGLGAVTYKYPGDSNFVGN